MREIKFRAWSKHLKRYFYNISPLPFGFIASHPILAQPDLVAPTLVMQGIEYEVVIEQYTGLKDKNGKEIYEGDIVKGKSIGIITWDLTCCWYSVVSNLVTYPIKPYTEILFNNGEEWEIIGNIHENPELLEGE